MFMLCLAVPCCAMSCHAVLCHRVADLGLVGQLAVRKLGSTQSLYGAQVRQTRGRNTSTCPLANGYENFYSGMRRPQTPALANAC